MSKRPALTLVLAIWTIPLQGQAQPRKKLTVGDEWNQAQAFARSTKSVLPQKGFIPDEETAARIAETIAKALFGDREIKRQLPFRARLKGSVWTVLGSMSPETGLGGVAIVQLDKTTGQVLFAHHTQ